MNALYKGACAGNIIYTDNMLSVGIFASIVCIPLFFVFGFFFDLAMQRKDTLMMKFWGWCLGITAVFLAGGIAAAVANQW